jgi:peroxiredoxin family protein
MMEDDITAILKEEKIEKDMRLAEMEANKASNLIQHQVCDDTRHIEIQLVLSHGAQQSVQVHACFTLMLMFKI